MKKHTFLVADDHPLFRLGLKNLLTLDYPSDIILEASDGKEALDIITSKSIDCLLLDISMPVMDGLTLLSNLKKMRIHVKTIVLTIYNEPSLIHHLLEMGVQGYVPKGHSIENIKIAIDIILRGGMFYPLEFDEKLKRVIQSGNVYAIKISDKERQILDLLAQGLTGIEIAEVTGYTKRTVETKKSRLEKRLKVKSAPALIHLAHKLGLLN